MKHVRAVTLFENRLICSCSEMIVYGLPCQHVLHVASTIPNWKRPIHYDVSVRWWKAYYYYGITDNLKTDSDRTIHKMLRLLRKKETVGLNVKQEDVCNLPINISNGNIPSIYNHNSHLPFPYNYPDIDYTSIRVCEESGSIPGMSQ